MDPLVRSLLWLQQGVARASGMALSFGLGVYLVCWAADPPGQLWNGVAVAALVISLGFRLARRLGRMSPEEQVRIDLELFTHLVVGAYAAILSLPGGLEGPYYPIVYAVMMLVAGFSRPTAALFTVGFAILLEATLGYVSFGYQSGDKLWPHAALLGVFTFLNLALFRAEIARIRRLSRSRIEAELTKMKEAARSYRLIGAPASAAGTRSVRPPHDAEDRVLHSGVEEIHEALQFALDLLRRTLGLSTAVLLWLDGSGDKLIIQELSTEDDAIAPGPFSARDGLIAASLSRGTPVSLAGAKAVKHVPYYSVPPNVGSVCAVPVMDHGHARGVLIVDRATREPFTSIEEELLSTATHFVLRAIENERVFVQLERAKIEQGKLYRAADTLSAATTETQVIEAGVTSAREFASFDYAVVTLFHKHSGEHEICAVSGEDPEKLVGRRFRHNSGLVSMVVANRHPLPYRGDYDPAKQVVFTRRLSPPNMPSLLVLPLLVHERALGTLVLGSSRRGAFGDAVRPTLEVLASHMAVSLANARMLKRLEELATTDGLTGLVNKRTLVEIAAQKLRSARRFKKPLSVLVCDIDHFKKVNDTYGHDVGDEVIRGFAGVLKRCKRDTDVVGRFGGEEFVLVCEETDAQGANLLAERIRTEIEATTFHTELGELSVTCSVGVAPFPAAGHDWEGLFKSTDEALYVSKRSGRNKVTVWKPRMQGAAA